MPKPSDAELAKMKQRLIELAGTLDSLRSEQAQLGLVLKPVFEHERNVIERIRNTHGTGATFNPHRAPQRTPLFEALLQIAVQHGKTKSAYGDVKRRANAYMREAEKIERELSQHVKEDHA
jgi:hypothetical protein